MKIVSVLGLFIISLLFACSVKADQTTVSVEFNSKGVLYTSGSVAGVIPQDPFTWNVDQNESAVTTTSGTVTTTLHYKSSQSYLLDSNNNSTNISETTTNSGYAYGNGNASSFANPGDNDLMYSGYVAGGSVGSGTTTTQFNTFTLTLGGLTSGSNYSVILFADYQYGYGNSQVTGSAQGSSAHYFFTVASQNQSSKWIRATATSATGSALIANYAEWTNLQCDALGNLSVYFTATNGFSVPGFQLIESVPEPAERWLFGIAVAGVIGYQIRRRYLRART